MIEFITTNLILFIAILIIAILVSAFAIAGICYVIKKFWFIAEQVTILLEMVEEYKKHLDYINHADRLFGDPTIIGLIDHSEILIKDVQIFLDTFKFMQVEKTEESTEDDDEGNS